MSANANANVSPNIVAAPAVSLGRLPGSARQVSAIARFTLQEAVSRRLILAGLVLSAAFLALFALGFSFLYNNIAESAARRPSNSAQSLAAAAAIFTVLGLYAVNFLSSFMALFLSVGAVSGEVDAGTLHAVLARPLRRAEFVVGRWLAYVGLTAAYVAAMAGLLLLISSLISGYTPPEPLRAVGLMTLGAVSLLSISLLGSTIMPTLANGVVAFTLFGLAWMGGIIEFVGRMLDNLTMLNLGTAVSLLVPSDAIWRGASYYIQSPLMLAASGAANVPFISGSPPTTAMVTWALIYPFVLLGAAVWAFGRRDL